ncbi:hypothetical protein GWI33_017389 [Rhynchophorus ferrugineus]|uniref:Uncharacterized protein n=1 Tax=Rhynchophorus ferrugineus TaxID=354439 RepID=A0A834MIF2_RHYFE|nr:hypothetical protein GWI33_017389 [Rhynchophorus ferrugineus]
MKHVPAGRRIVNFLTGMHEDAVSDKLKQSGGPLDTPTGLFRAQNRENIRGDLSQFWTVFVGQSNESVVGRVVFNQ